MAILDKEIIDKVAWSFESNVEIPRVGVGKKQTIETLINEEALLFAKFLRNLRKKWTQRTAVPKLFDNS